MEAEARASLDDVILKSVELPVLPATTQRALSLMSDPDVSVEKIKRIISTDPGLATKILKVANSAFYGGYRNIENLSQAILRLGLNAVRNIVVATSMKNAYKRFGLTEKLLWEQMVGSAMASSIIAKQTRLVDHEDAFIGGLLHDVGKVVLNNEYPDEFAKVMEKVYNEDVTFAEAEKTVFDFTQRDVGAVIVKKWGFPESIESLLRHFDDAQHLSSDRQLCNLVTIIMFSDRICQKFGMGWRTPAGDDVDFGNLPESLELGEDDIEEIFEKSQEAFNSGAELF